METDDQTDNRTDKMERPPIATLSAMPAAAQWKRAALMAKTVTAFKETVDEDSDDDVDTKQQIKYGNTTQAAWAIFSEYCDNSTIHGIKYLGEQKRPCLERFFWIMVFVFSIYTCATLTMNIWDKWNNNPVIVSFAEKSTPVWEIPFPAVTVCPETKARQRAFNYTASYWMIRDKMDNTTTDEMEPEQNRRMQAVAQVCEAHLLESFNWGENFTTGSQIIEALSQVMPHFRETYLQCKWRNTDKKCGHIFQKIITEEGVCYSFNSLNPEEIYRDEGLIPEVVIHKQNRSHTDWNVEDGYNVNADPESFPHRVLGPGARAGLYMVLNGLEQDFDDMCRGPVQGFKILLHTPGEVAQVSKQYFRVPFDQEVLISIKPKIITTSEGLKHYEPHRRQCYFQKERYLRYFQIYTQSNCELECLANYTYTQCGCVKFSMPRHTGVPVCGSAKIACYNSAEDQLLLKEFNQGLEKSGKEFRAATDCDCLPACTSIAYEAEISQADFDYKMMTSSMASQKLSQDYTPDPNESSKMARLSIFFKEAQFLTSKRSELYGTTDFLANCGGLLGLFMGVSTLSIVEIIYFCTVRLITNLKMRRKKRKEIANGMEASKDA